jgi:hypothetical protein
MDPSYREKTLAVITSASPIQGSLLTPSLAALLSQLYERDPMAATKLVSSIFDRMPLGFEAIEPTASSGEEFLHTVLSLTPAHSEAGLYKNYTKKALLKADGKPLRVFHLAGLIDTALVQAFPKLTLRNGSVEPLYEKTTFNPSNGIELLGLPTHYHYPLGDGVIALEQAVLPEKLDHGAKAELLGVLRSTHGGMRFEGNNLEAPHDDSKIIDSILAVVARRLGE